MFLGLQAEGVHVDTLAWYVLVVLIRLDKVEVTPVHLGKPVVAVELDLGAYHWVGAALEGSWHEHAVGTTSSYAGHATCKAVGIWGSDDVGNLTRAIDVTVSSRAGEGGVAGIGVVEPLRSIGAISHSVGILLYYPYQFFGGVIKVEFDFVAGGGGGFVTSELELLDKVLMTYLCEAATFVSVQVDVIYEEGCGLQVTYGHGALVEAPGAGYALLSPVQVL